MMTLYFKERTKATRPRWLLEELNELGPPVPFELRHVDFERGENKTPWYLAIHPHGLVPALVDGDTSVFETAAICLYLADAYLERGLAPQVGTPARAAYYQWVAWCLATLEPAIGQYAWNTSLLPEAERVPRLAEAGRARFAECLVVLGGALRGPYILGDRFSAADVLLGGNLLWARRSGLLGETGPVAAYLASLLARPAARRAFS